MADVWKWRTESGSILGSGFWLLLCSKKRINSRGTHRCEKVGVLWSRTTKEDAGRPREQAGVLKSLFLKQLVLKFLIVIHLMKIQAWPSCEVVRDLIHKSSILGFVKITILKLRKCLFFNLLPCTPTRHYKVLWKKSSKVTSFCLESVLSILSQRVSRKFAVFSLAKNLGKSK